jgi:PAS domain S-box-containing protein
MSDGRIIEVNAGFENLTGFTAREVQDKSTLDLNIWADAADRAAVVEEISKNSSLQGIELNFLKKSGEHVTGFFSAETITINNQTALLASISDITERKRTEERVKALLAEKELILIEVHHRVKNNLNAIYSLLNLQAAEHGDSSAAGALHDAAGRVRSMMMLYDKLYRSEIVTEISIDTYFPPLIDEIVGLFPGEAKPKVETAIDLIVLKAKTVSTLGIILNELITNAMKYAVRDRRDAALRLSAAGRDGTISISFEDNGPGIPESVTVENSSGFGMRLVDMLVKQMGGTVRIERHDGTRFIIKFRE